MPVTVNANATNSPPQLEVTIASPDASAMTSVSLTRIAAGVRAATRVQPSSGVASRYIEDPEAPWDTWVAYSATYTTATLGTVTETSANVRLVPDPLGLWAIHPTIPALSVRLDSGDPAAMGVAEIGDVVRSAQATQHTILGGDLPVLTRLGNRKAPATQLTLTAVSANDRARIVGLIRDETPLLLRAPAGWGWGWDEGYYAIGDAAFARRLQYGPDQSRTIRLPVNQVAAPAGVQQSNWSFGGLAAGYADFGAIANAFADFNAVTGNNPG